MSKDTHPVPRDGVPATVAIPDEPPVVSASGRTRPLQTQSQVQQRYSFINVDGGAIRTYKQHCPKSTLKARRNGLQLYSNFDTLYDSNVNVLFTVFD